MNGLYAAAGWSLFWAGAVVALDLMWAARPWRRR